MTYYDVFNGDADGICALQQLRLDNPRDSVLVSGLKRDIKLLQQVDAVSGDELTVLDLSLDSNRDALVALLARGVRILYVDHHFSGAIPDHDLLDCKIDTTADTCTSLIINSLLANRQAQWAVVGAYGDNFDAPAAALGGTLGCGKDQLRDLQQLGICLNYNGYGVELEDLLFHPVDLYNRVHPYSDPLDFIANEIAYAQLLTQYLDDMERARQTTADSQSSSGAVYLLPNEGWARRAVGVLGNDLAKRFPGRAHALLVDVGAGHYRVSVRAPYHRKEGADELCRQFPSGGGRKAAGGINALPEALLTQFIDRFKRQFDGAK